MTLSDDEIGRQERLAKLATAIAQQRKAEAEQVAAEATADKAKAEADKAKKDATADPESDTEVIQARKKARLAVLAQEQAESDAAARKAALPDAPTIAKIEAEVDKSPKVDAGAGAATANLVASMALDITGDEIGRALREALSAAHIQSGTVWIVDHAPLAQREVELLALSARLDAFTSAFQPPAATAKKDTTGVGEEPGGGPTPEVAGIPSVAGEVASLAVTSGTAFAKFGVELVGALRSRYALHGREVDLERAALVASALRALRNPLVSSIDVRWPTLASVSKAPLVVKFAEACRARDEFAGQHLYSQPPDGDEAAKERQDRAKALVDSFDAYAVTILAVPADGSASPLVAAGLLEVTVPREASPEASGAYLLQLDITEQGADAITGYGLVHGTSASFVGFVQAYYVLSKPDGTVITAGTVTNRKFARLNVKDAKVEVGREN